MLLGRPNTGVTRERWRPLAEALVGFTPLFGTVPSSLDLCPTAREPRTLTSCWNCRAPDHRRCRTSFLDLRGWRRGAPLGHRDCKRRDTPATGKTSPLQT